MATVTRTPEWAQTQGHSAPTIRRDFETTRVGSPTILDPALAPSAPASMRTKPRNANPSANVTNARRRTSLPERNSDGRRPRFCERLRGRTVADRLIVAKRRDRTYGANKRTVDIAKWGNTGVLEMRIVVAGLALGMLSSVSSAFAECLPESRPDWLECMKRAAEEDLRLFCASLTVRAANKLRHEVGQPQL